MRRRRRIKNQFSPSRGDRAGGDGAEKAAEAGILRRERPWRSHGDWVTAEGEEQARARVSLFLFRHRCRRLPAFCAFGPGNVGPRQSVVAANRTVTRGIVNPRDFVPCPTIGNKTTNKVLLDRIQLGSRSKPERIHTRLVSASWDTVNGFLFFIHFTYWYLVYLNQFKYLLVKNYLFKSNFGYLSVRITQIRFLLSFMSDSVVRSIY